MKFLEDHFSCFKMSSFKCPWHRNEPNVKPAFYGCLELCLHSLLSWKIVELSPSELRNDNGGAEQSSDLIHFLKDLGTVLVEKVLYLHRIPHLNGPGLNVSYWIVNDLQSLYSHPFILSSQCWKIYKKGSLRLLLTYEQIMISRLAYNEWDIFADFETQWATDKSRIPKNDL